MIKSGGRLFDSVAGTLLCTLFVGAPPVAAQEWNGRHYTNSEYGFSYTKPERPGGGIYPSCVQETSWAHGSGFFLTGDMEMCLLSDFRPFVAVGGNVNSDSPSVERYSADLCNAGIADDRKQGIRDSKIVMPPQEIRIAGQRAALCMAEYGDGRINLIADIFGREMWPGTDIAKSAYYIDLKTTRDRFDEDFKVYLKAVASFRLTKR